MAVPDSDPVTLTLVAPTGQYRRADLAFRGVDHSKASFEVRLFLNNPEAGPSTPTSHKSYAGSFWVFGHGGCAGSQGHCEPPSERRPFDFRLEHQLTPISKTVIVTKALRSETTPGEPFTLRLVPVVRTDHAQRLSENLVHDIFHFDRVDLLTYQ